MFKNLTIYRPAPDCIPSLEDMETALSAATFVPCGPTQEQSIGWIPPRGEDNGALVESVAGQRIMRLRIETRGVPATAVRKKAQEAADRIEAETGRKPGKKETKQLREDAKLALLPQAFPRQSDVWVWLDVDNNTLVTDASSQHQTDEVVTALVRTFDNLALALLQTEVNPVTAMTHWLSATDPAEWPGEFSVERECELKSGDEEKSVVKFSRHNLATEEIRKHIAEGKLPTRLAMSYDGRVGFVLTQGLQLRKITFLDGAFDDAADNKDTGFDADVAIATGELQNLIPALIDALGGEMVHQVQEGGAS